MKALDRFARASSADPQNTEFAVRTFRECERTEQEIPAWVFPVLCERPYWWVIQKNRNSRSKTHFLSLQSSSSACGEVSELDFEMSWRRRVEDRNLVNCAHCDRASHDKFFFQDYFPSRTGILIEGISISYRYTRLIIRKGENPHCERFIRIFPIKKELQGLLDQKEINPYKGAKYYDAVIERRESVLDAFKIGDAR